MHWYEQITFGEYLQVLPGKIRQAVRPPMSKDDVSVLHSQGLPRFQISEIQWVSLPFFSHEARKLCSTRNERGEERRYENEGTW